MDNDKIGKFIMEKRLEKGLTQNELGEKLFITGKAISKWERGLSLPDICLLEKLALELDTDIYEILQIKKTNNIDIEKEIEKEKLLINKRIKKKILCVFIPIVLIIIVVLFKLIPFGYRVQHVEYEDKILVDLGIPKFSFDMKGNNGSYSYKSLRGENILYSEMKYFVNNLEHVTCLGTTYYYNEVSDTTIINYKVEKHILYNTMVYDVKRGNYCDVVIEEDYLNKIGRNNKTYILNTIDDGKEDYRIIFNVNVKDKRASLVAYKKDSKSEYKLYENSWGTFEIINDELIYYRNKINSQDEKVEIPYKSSFIIKNDKLIHKAEYLPVVLK